MQSATYLSDPIPFGTDIHSFIHSVFFLLLLLNSLLDLIDGFIIGNYLGLVYRNSKIVCGERDRERPSKRRRLLCSALLCSALLSSALLCHAAAEKKSTAAKPRKDLSASCSDTASPSSVFRDNLVRRKW